MQKELYTKLILFVNMHIYNESKFYEFIIQHNLIQNKTKSMIFLPKNPSKFNRYFI